MITVLRTAPVRPSAGRDRTLLQLSWGLTLVRVPLLLLSLVYLAAGSPWTASSLIGAFVICDIADGGFARRTVTGDSAARRAADSVVDRISVFAALLVASTIDAHFLILALIVFASTAGAASSAYMTLLRVGVVFKAPQWHKIWSLGYALCGVTLAFGHVATALGFGVASTCVYAITTRSLWLTHASLRSVATAG